MLAYARTALSHGAACAVSAVRGNGTAAGAPFLEIRRRSVPTSLRQYSEWDSRGGNIENTALESKQYGSIFGIYSMYLSTS